MIYVGIDVAKDKHDCFITNSDGGFNDLYQKIVSVMEDVTKVKVGLEATGHYSYNLLGYPIDKGLPAYVINPDNWMVLTHIWKNEVPDTCDMLCTMLPSTSAIGTQHLPLI